MTTSSKAVLFWLSSSTTRVLCEMFSLPGNVENDGPASGSYYYK